MDMFWKSKSHKKTVTFDRNPRLSGKVDVFFGVPLAALWLLRCYELDSWTNSAAITSYIVLAYIIFGGLYKLLIAKGAQRVQMELGGLYHRMYLRLGRWFVPVGIGASVVVYVGASLLLSAFSDGDVNAWLEDLRYILTTFAWALMLMMYTVVNRYVIFREYYRYAAAQREDTD